MTKKHLQWLAASCVIAALLSCDNAPPVHYDVLIQGGTIVDGSGTAAHAGNIAINGDTIVEIGELEGATATRIIDASGHVVSPGFIDLHTHADRNIHQNPGAENYLFQGVTTLVVGNCGNSPVHLDEYFLSVEEARIAPNLGMLIGHNAVRAEVMGNDNRAPTDDELAGMKGLVKAAM
ncbi:MAG TPA: amidohydrolase family protein, partial [Woeseiaceae bacterium]|nr:amidohydrolase family protein [Woeseiaceae bacterium]